MATGRVTVEVTRNMPSLARVLDLVEGWTAERRIIDVTGIDRRGLDATVPQARVVSTPVMGSVRG